MRHTSTIYCSFLSYNARKCLLTLHWMVSTQVPLHVINNYFSIGADAQVALDFHESRGAYLSCCMTFVMTLPWTEARPDKFDTRFKNKFFYALQGGKDVLQRKFADLSQHIKVFVSVMCYHVVQLVLYTLGWRWRNYTENTSTKISCHSLIEHSSVHIHLLCMYYCSVYTGMALVLYHGGTPI